MTTNETVSRQSLEIFLTPLRQQTPRGGEDFSVAKGDYPELSAEVGLSLAVPQLGLEVRGGEGHDMLRGMAMKDGNPEESCENEF